MGRSAGKTGTTTYKRAKVTQRTDANSVSTYSYYDNNPCAGCGGSQGQLTKSTDGLGNDTYYYYDANSRMTKMKNALNQETDFVYDCLGRRVTTTFPSGKHGETWGQSPIKGQVQNLGLAHIRSL